ncbi:hypothetical protein D3C74_235200 [compost metagenome]
MTLDFIKGAPGVEMSELLGLPLLKSAVGEHIWDLQRQGQPQAFQQKLVEYFSKGYPGWSVVRFEYPTVYLRDDRIKK